MTARTDEVVAWQLRYRFWDGAPWGQWHGYPTEAMRNAEADMFSAGNWLTESRDLTDVAALQSANARLAELSDWMHTLAADLNQSAIAEGEIGLRGMCIDGRNRLLDKIKELRRAAAGEGDANQGDGE